MKRLHEAWSRVTPDDIVEGSSWYLRARLDIAAIAERHGAVLDTAIDVTAALSPGCKWERNLIDTETVLSGGAASVTTYGSNREKALAIARDEGKLSGPKVEAFAGNIRGEQMPVTVDRHIIRLCLGRDRKPTERIVRRCTTGIQQLAREVGLSPATTQATLWTLVRRGG